MASTVNSRAQSIERSDLATFLKSPRLLKQMENVIDDVATTLPGAIDQISVDVETAQTTANTALSNAATAQATANTALSNAATAQATVNALAQRDVPLPLVDAATITVDAVAHNSFSVTLGGNRTLDAPTNLADGMLLNFAIRQDGAGGRTLAFHAIYDFGAAGTPILSTAASVVDYVMGYYDLTSGKILASFRKGGAAVTSASFSANNNGVAQSIPSGAFTKLTFSTEEFDVGALFASSTWTPPAGKVVLLTGSMTIDTVAGALTTVAVYKNGAEFKRGDMQQAQAVGPVTMHVSATDIPNGTDTYELFGYQATGVAKNTTGGTTLTYFQGTTISP